jgi:hypothetical protein
VLSIQPDDCFTKSRCSSLMTDLKIGPTRSARLVFINLESINNKTLHDEEESHYDLSSKCAFHTHNTYVMDREYHEQMQRLQQVGHAFPCRSIPKADSLSSFDVPSRTSNKFQCLRLDRNRDIIQIAMNRKAREGASKGPA